MRVWRISWKCSIIATMLKKVLPLFVLCCSALPALFSCGNSDQVNQVQLDFGTHIDTGSDALITPLSQIQWVKKSKINQLVKNQSSFLMLLHGSGDECTCYTEWHNKVLAPYVKRNSLLVYGVTLAEFESDSEYLGVNRISGSDTLAIFENGTLRYQHDTSNLKDAFVSDPVTFSNWMKERVSLPKIYTVSSEILDGFYEGNEPFTIYYGRDSCPDCSYLSTHLLKDYLKTTNVVKKTFLYFDFDAFYARKGTPEYEGYLEKKAAYGLASSEENPAGFGAGMFPTIYYVQPNGEDRQGDVIQAAGVFFNESIKDGTIQGSYFTKERYEEARDSYLEYLDEKEGLTTKWIEGTSLSEDLSDRHEALKPYEKPLFEALLDFAVADE